MNRKKKTSKRKSKITGYSNQDNVMPIIVDRESKIVLYSGYAITDDEIKVDDISDWPREIEDQAPELYDLAQNNPRAAIERLETLKESYPHTAPIYNYLAIAYSRDGDSEKVKEIAVENYKKHPSYLFAKINYAEICLRENKIEEIPEIFENQTDLEMLYPKRKLFHITEVIGFIGIMGLYRVKKGEIRLAETYYNLLKTNDPAHPLTITLGRMILLEKIKNKVIGFLGKK